jgi:hypothetical protein
MAPRLELAGKRYGKLVVTSFAFSKNGAHWNCTCDCGKTSIVRASMLTTGTTKSCGCGMIEQAKQNCKSFRDRNSWIPCEVRRKLKDMYTNMVKRCCDPRNHRYKNYGGRGIRICDEWLHPATGRQAFYRWAVANGCQPHLQIDRINVDLGYFPQNCRFVDRIEQLNNTTRNHYITWQGKTQTMSEWAKELGLSYCAMQHRLDRGWPMERIASQPQRRSRDA